MNTIGNLRVRELIADVRSRLDELEQLCDTDQVISCTEAARYLKLHPTTVSRYIAEGKLHKIRRGSRMGLSMSEVERLKRR